MFAYSQGIQKISTLRVVRRLVQQASRDELYMSDGKCGDPFDISFPVPLGPFADSPQQYGSEKVWDEMYRRVNILGTESERDRPAINMA